MELRRARQLALPNALSSSKHPVVNSSPLVLILTSMDFFLTIAAPAPLKVEEVDELPQVNEDSSAGSSGSCVVA
ncbi:hypothetical protein DFH09DRAFT_1311980 [Mycena vulgaris]|nr:hypothetical protein DFH09DRAFT_1311980 [Mycena vulgaris]